MRLSETGPGCHEPQKKSLCSVFSDSIMLGAAARGGYQIGNSLIFNDGDSAYLSRTSGTPTDSNVWTASFWTKRGVLSGNHALFSARKTDSNTQRLLVYFNTSDQLQMNGTPTVWRQTQRSFRDPSAWYHIVIAVDTDQGTAADRIKIYVNGVEETSFGASSDPGSGADLGVNVDASPHSICRDQQSGSNYYDGYMSEFILVDGQALAPTVFGEFDSENTKLWKPKRYTGSFGNNGFYLDFADSADPGNDVSGEGNDFTPTNLASADQSTDTPTDNHATFSSIVRNPQAATYSQGNTTLNRASSGNATGVTTIAVDAAENTYVEFVLDAGANDNIECGILAADVAEFHNPGAEFRPSDSPSGYGYRRTGNLRNNGSDSAYGDSYVATEVVGVHLNAGVLTFYNEGVSQGVAASGLTGEFFFTACGQSGVQWTIRAASDDWDMTPTGAVALSTANLPTPDVKDPQNSAAVLLHTGNGGTQSVSGAAFQADFVLTKARSASNNWVLTDSVRGVNSQLNMDIGSGEQTATDVVTAFNSDGFSVGDNSELSSGSVNGSGISYVNLLLKELPGFFDIADYTGDGVAGLTASHDLGAVPGLFIVKDRDGSNNWTVYSETIGASQILELNTTGSASASSVAWDDTTPDISNIVLGNSGNTNVSGHDYIAYLLASKPGLCAVGSYEGNGDSDGPFVYTGGRVLALIIKEADAGGSWVFKNRVTDSENPNTYGLFLDSSSSENTSDGRDVDFLSSGFKVRANQSDINTSNSTYIYIAILDGALGGARVPAMTAQ